MRSGFAAGFFRPCVEPRECLVEVLDFEHLATFETAVFEILHRDEVRFVLASFRVRAPPDVDEHTTMRPNRSTA